LHLAEEQIERISPELVYNYTELHRADELAYWLTNVAKAEAAANLRTLRAGGVRVEFEGTTPVIIAEAVCFSALLHEMGKGVMELQSFHGLEQDPVKLQKILAFTDTIGSELWDLRYGPLFWDKTFKAIGAEDGRARLHALKELYQIPAERFNIIVRDLLSDQQQARNFLKELGAKYNS